MNGITEPRSFAYNRGGYLTRRMDRRGLVREFQYDTLGRNTAEIWYDTAADAEMDANRQNTLNFTYDALGRMLSAGDQFAGYAYTYDRLGRMISSDAAIAGLAPTVTLTNAYDAAGRRTQVAATIGGNADYLTDYAYDQLGRTTSIRQSASPTSVLPVADKRVDFTYDLASQPVALTRFADLSGNQLVAATDYLFDQAGRLTGMTHSKGTSVFADYDWTFDEANRMTRFESLIDGVADYTNDDTGQLTAAEYTAGAGLPTAPPDEQYVYDENGNRMNNGYTTGPNNQLLSDGIHTYTYDEEGNRTSKTSITTGEVTEYHWDHRNRLTRVSTRAIANGPLTTDIHYAYDFGQRWIRKTLDTNADGTIEESRIFVHDNGQIVLDFQTTGTGDASSGDLSHRYLWGHHVDQILADETVDTAAGDVAWTLTDHLNTVRDLAAYDAATDTTTVIKHLTYDAFGNVTSDSAPGIDSLFLFTARPYDPDTGLQNNLNRWYDLSTGRWMSEDPIGFDAGDVNLYRYVENTTLWSVDPTGYWKRVGNTSIYEAERDGETLEELAVTVSQDGSDWVCIWPRPTLIRQIGECGETLRIESYENWEDYPAARKCALADVRNLRARQGQNLILQGTYTPNRDDNYQRALAHVLGNRGGERGVHLRWTEMEQAIEQIKRLSKEGGTPIGGLIIGGHHNYNGSIGGTAGAGAFSAADVVASATERDNRTNSLDSAKRDVGPPKCWFTKNATVYGAACTTSRVWTQQWAQRILRRGATAYGTPSNLLGEYGRSSGVVSWRVWFEDRANITATNVYELVRLPGWISVDGTQ
jgi:RHS repeat-associated protein